MGITRINGGQRSSKEMRRMVAICPLGGCVLSKRKLLGCTRARLWTTLGLVLCLTPTASGYAAASVDNGQHNQKSDVTPSESEQPEDRFVIVEGQITDPLGCGERDVAVTARWKAEGDAEGALIGKVTTNAFGDFVITSPTPIRGDIVVTFSKPVYTSLTRQLRVGDENFPPFLGETLEGSLVVAGRVEDKLAKQAISGATVTLKAMQKDWHQKTDQAGRFTIKGVFPGRGELIVEAEGFGREQHAVPVLEDAADIVVRLKPERIVRVSLLDDLGKPIAGATVECFDKLRDDFRTGVTDPSGQVVFHGFHLDANALDVRLTHQDYVSTEGFDRTITMQTDQRESLHQFVMERAGRISGRVTRADTGAPANGARVMTGEANSDGSPRGWADYRGRYTIAGVRPGPVVVTVHLAGFAPELLTVDVQAGKAADLDIHLRPGAVLKGIVKDEESRPLPGVFVDAVRWRGFGTLGLRAMTGEDGRFVVEDAPHDEFEIVATARGAAFKSSPSVRRTVRAGSDTDIEMVLPISAREVARPRGMRLQVGSAAPPFKLTTLAGQTFRFEDLKGKTVLLDFWATWCGPCVAELPHLSKLYERFGAREDFAMLSISLDDSEEILRDFVSGRKLKWHQVFGEAGGAHNAAESYGVTGLPAVFLIDPGGKLVAFDLHGAALVETVEQVLYAKDSP